jgi:hypothetical protein
VVPRLDRPGFSYLATTASNNTWYPYSFMEEVAKNEPGISSGLQVLDQLVADALARGEVTKRLYAGMGRLINDDEIAFARTMMDRVGGTPK